MRTLRIRAFTLLCLLLITLLPWVFFVGAQYLETRSFGLAPRGAQSEVLQHQIREAIRLIETGKDRWADPDWQNRAYTELRKAKMDVAIESASGQEIYTSNPDRRSTRSSVERISVIEDGRLVGRATLLLPRSYTVQAMISAAAGLLLAFFIIGVEMRRFLLKPLEKMSAAARQIASGDWDVRLPRSRITEIAEVRDGFDTMVKGLEQAHRKQAELEEGRRFVIAAVAHDLRTPLFALRGYLDGLEQGIAKSPEKVAQYLAVCKEKSAQLDLLVEDLFTYTKLEYLETEFHKKTLDLGLILRKSADNLKARAAEKQIVLSVHPDGDGLVSGDAHLLERAMNNILENAVRHTPIGG
ncbi:sensor histidine kinase, partial [Paenibacillus phocaensis]|uniref:sensor histidine kinase n=1 Tax=Paenibacillus phocaensis TaxID=1776378 RepID=UPI000839BBB9